MSQREMVRGAHPTLACYGYDVNGRRISIGGSLARTDLPTALSSATYNAANQLTQWDASSFTYDTNGNLTSDGSKSYTWDARNRLAALSGAMTASFQYDAFDRRSGKTVGGTTTGFLYDGLNALQELVGTTPSATLLTGLGIDEIFVRSDTSGDRHFLTDALGSTLALTDGNGVMQTRYSYEPYGKTTASGATSGNSSQYTGRENDGTGCTTTEHDTTIRQPTASSVKILLDSRAVLTRIAMSKQTQLVESTPMEKTGGALSRRSERMFRP